MLTQSGAAHKVLAAKLAISENTLRNHLRSIYVAYSDADRPLIPTEIGHLFRG